MCKLGAAIAIAACLVQGYLSLDRNDIINEYQPILNEKAANLTAEYNLAVTQTNLIIVQVKNDTWTTVALMNTQIVNLRTTIANAKKASVNNAKALNCIKEQDPAAGKLTSVAINSTCWVGFAYPELVQVTNALGILAKIPNATIEACTTLDPLSSQDELFFDCITHKISDLDEQVVLLKSSLVDAETLTINRSVECLAAQSALIGEEINEINLQVSLCLSLR